MQKTNITKGRPAKKHTLKEIERIEDLYEKKKAEKRYKEQERNKEPLSAAERMRRYRERHGMNVKRKTLKSEIETLKATVAEQDKRITDLTQKNLSINASMWELISFEAKNFTAHGAKGHAWRSLPKGMSEEETRRYCARQSLRTLPKKIRPEVLNGKPAKISKELIPNLLWLVDFFHNLSDDQLLDLSDLTQKTL